MKRPTVIETLAFLGLALTGLRTDRPRATPQGESGELTHLTSFGQHTDISVSRGFENVLVQAGTHLDVGPVDTVVTWKTKKKKFNQPHTSEETKSHD